MFKTKNLGLAVKKKSKIFRILAVLLVVMVLVPSFGLLSYADDDDDDGGGGGGADEAYKKVINFFITWLTRVGFLVALIGGVMFGLAIKNNDAEQKQTGILTMVAGFVVAAICGAADMFNLFA
jgi:hypothetical protein